MFRLIAINVIRVPNHIQRYVTILSTDFQYHVRQMWIGRLTKNHFNVEITILTYVCALLSIHLHLSNQRGSQVHLSVYTDYLS